MKKQQAVASKQEKVGKQEKATKPAKDHQKAAKPAGKPECEGCQHISYCDKASGPAAVCGIIRRAEKRAKEAAREEARAKAEAEAAQESGTMEALVQGKQIGEDGPVVSVAKSSKKPNLKQTIFDKIIQKAKVAAGVQLPNIEEAIEDVTGKYSLFEEERASVMKNLISGGDTSKWDLVNAITATAHRNVKDYDRSTELEKIGGDVLVNYMPRLLKAA